MNGKYRRSGAKRYWRACTSCKPPPRVNFTGHPRPPTPPPEGPPLDDTDFVPAVLTSKITLPLDRTKLTTNIEVYWQWNGVDPNGLGPVTIVTPAAGPGPVWHEGPNISFSGPHPVVVRMLDPSLNWASWQSANDSSLPNDSFQSKLRLILQWGTFDASSLGYAPDAGNGIGVFEGCAGLTETGTGIIPITLPTDQPTLGMNSCASFFKGCGNLTHIKKAQHWDLSEAQTMERMFDGCTALNTADGIRDWTTVLVKSMSKTFQDAESFNYDLSWNTMAVEDMSSMFHNAKTFNQTLTSSAFWTVDAVQTMESMFEGASAFNNGDPTGVSGEAVLFDDVYAAVTTMKAMFKNATSFNANIEGWKMPVLANMESMFEGAEVFNRNLAATNEVWLGPSLPLTSLRRVFKDAKIFNNGAPSKLVDATSNKTLLHWDVTAVTDLSGCFMGAEKFNNGNPLFNSWSGWSTNNVEYFTSAFEGATEFNIYIGVQSSWRFPGAVSLRAMFRNARDFNQSEDPGVPSETIHIADSTSLKDMSFMYNNAVSFNTTGFNGGGADGWPMGEITTIESIFDGASMFTAGSTGGNPHTIFTWSEPNQCTNMRRAFKGTILSPIVSFDAWDPSGVTDMSEMFFDSSFNKDLSSWAPKMSSVTDMSNMFSESGLSQANWNALAAALGAGGPGGNAESLQDGVNWSGNMGLDFSSADASGNARYSSMNLINNKQWTITPDPSGVAPPSLVSISPNMGGTLEDISANGNNFGSTSEYWDDYGKVILTYTGLDGNSKSVEADASWVDNENIAPVTIPLLLDASGLPFPLEVRVQGPGGVSGALVYNVTSLVTVGATVTKITAGNTGIADNMVGTAPTTPYDLDLAGGNPSGVSGWTWPLSPDGKEWAPGDPIDPFGGAFASVPWTFTPQNMPPTVPNYLPASGNPPGNPQPGEPAGTPNPGTELDLTGGYTITGTLFAFDPAKPFGGDGEVPITLKYDFEDNSANLISEATLGRPIDVSGITAITVPHLPNRAPPHSNFGFKNKKLDADKGTLSVKNASGNSSNILDIFFRPVITMAKIIPRINDLRAGDTAGGPYDIDTVQPEDATGSGLACSTVTHPPNGSAGTSNLGRNFGASTQNWSWSGYCPPNTPNSGSTGFWFTRGIAVYGTNLSAWDTTGTNTQIVAKFEKCLGPPIPEPLANTGSPQNAHIAEFPEDTGKIPSNPPPAFSQMYHTQTGMNIDQAWYDIPLTLWTNGGGDSGFGTGVRDSLVGQTSQPSKNGEFWRSVAANKNNLVTKNNDGLPTDASDLNGGFGTENAPPNPGESSAGTPGTERTATGGPPVWFQGPPSWQWNGWGRCGLRYTYPSPPPAGNPKGGEPLDTNRSYPPHRAHPWMVNNAGQAVLNDAPPGAPVNLVPVTGTTQNAPALFYRVSFWRQATGASSVDVDTSSTNEVFVPLNPHLGGAGVQVNNSPPFYAKMIMVKIPGGTFRYDQTHWD